MDACYSYLIHYTSGQEDYDRIRPGLTYSDTNVVLILFGCDNLHSYSNVSLRWVPEIRHFCPKGMLSLAQNYSTNPIIT